jgi:SNF2 family DNA or RNA helicase
LFYELERLHSSSRLLLTGTPLQNNVLELWSLLGFLLPDVFHNIKQLSDWFSQPFEEGDGDDNAGGAEVDHTEEDISEGNIDNEMKDTCEVTKKATIKKLSGDKNVARKLLGYNLMSNNQSNSFKVSAEERQVIISSLHRILKPFLLRRLKADVLLDMLPKIERIVYCPLSALQLAVQDLMRKLIERHEASGLSLEQSSTGNPFYRMNFNNIVMQLRKLCNHPYLVLEDLRSIPDDLYDKYLISSCGKLSVLHRLLQELIPRRHQVLIFSQFTTMLDILEGYLYSIGIVAARLDGKLSREERVEQLNKFHTDEKCRVFLLSTRAGGVGLNLQTADTIILYDSDHNPQQDLQAMSRAHRLGQTREVLVLRLISTNSYGLETTGVALTIEERIMKKAMLKLKTEKEVIADGQFDMGTSLLNITERDLKQELKKEITVNGELDLKKFFSCGANREGLVDPERGGRSDTSNLLSSTALLKACRRSDGKVDADGEESDESVIARMNDCIPMLEELTVAAAADWKLWLNPEARPSSVESITYLNSNSLLTNITDRANRAAANQQFRSIMMDEANAQVDMKVKVHCCHDDII